MLKTLLSLTMNALSNAMTDNMQPDGKKRRPGRPATGRRDTVRVVVYLPPEIDAAIRNKLLRTGQSITAYFMGLARNDIERDDSDSNV